jgi:hypothetical protein
MFVSQFTVSSVTVRSMFKKQMGLKRGVAGVRRNDDDIALGQFIAFPLIRSAMVSRRVMLPFPWMLSARS